MRKIALILIFLLGGYQGFAQNSSDGTVDFEPLEFSSQNFVKYNGFLMNPTFSWLGKDQDYISLYHQSQMAGFDGAPKLYMLNYSTKVDANKGAALGVFQKSHGIFTSFGGYANFAYGIQISNKIWLALGANLVYFESGIKSSALSADPTLDNIGRQSAISLRPGLNLSIGKFDVGGYAENLVTYSFSDKKSIDEAKRFSGHLMFSSDLGEKTYMKVLARGQKQDSLLAYGGNLLFGLSHIGYLQAGYDIFEERSTISVGLGINITPNISVNYMMGKTSGEIDLKPTTHEIMFVYNFLGHGQSQATQTQAQEDPQTLQRLEKTQNELAEMKYQMQLNAQKRAAMQKRLDSIMQAERNRPADKVREIEVEVEDTPSVEDQVQAQATTKKLMVSAYDRTYFHNAEPGFYIIANVYANEKYLHIFMDNLREKDLFPGFFVKKSNGYSYVYIQRYDKLEHAIYGAKTHLNGNYTGNVWILEIK